MSQSIFLSQLQNNLLIDPTIKQQIIIQRDSLGQSQQDMIIQYVNMGSDIQGDLYQKAIDNNPNLEQGLQQIIQKYQTKTLASLGSDHDQAEDLLQSL